MSPLAQHYARDGVAFPFRVMSAAAAADARRGYEALHARDARFRKKPHMLVPWLADLVRSPAILDPVSEILGDDVLCWSSLFFAKPAGDPGYVAWHQDATYWGLSEPAVLTAWVAFTPSTRESGCLRVVPGSHLSPALPHRANNDAANMLSRSQEIAVAVDEAQAVDVVLAPGEMSLHHVMTVHGSEANRAAEPRIGYAIRYIAGHVRQTAGPMDSATLVRGRDLGNFLPEPSPVAPFDAGALAAHAAMLERQAEIAAVLG